MSFEQLNSKINRELEKENLIFFSYGGIFTQTLIVSLSDVLEKEGEYNDVDMSSLNKLFVVFVEISQNIMKYSPSTEKGMIAVSSDDNSYKIFGANVITKEQKEVIAKRLDEISGLNKDEIRKRYKELRKSGIYSHDKGGGIGFYEIARKSDHIEYEFIEDSNKIWFLLKVIINKKKKFEDDE